MLLALALALVAAGVAAAAALSAGKRPTAPGTSASTLQQRTLVKYIPTGSQLDLPQSVASQGVHSFGTSLAADAAGNVYAGVDTFSSIDRVVVFGPDGRYVRDWPTSVGGQAPRLAVGPDGLLYVANDITGRVSVHRLDGPLVRQLGGGLPVAGVMDLEVDAAGSVYLSRGNGPDGDDIVRYNAAGTVTGRFVPFPRATFGSPSGNYLRGLAVAPDGSIYVTTTSSAPKGRRYLMRLDASGKELKTLDIEFIFGGASYEDVELANGRLYLVGDIGHNYRIFDHRRDALVVLSLEGEVIDQIAGRGTAVAVHGEDVYVTGLKTRAGARVLAQESGLSIGHLSGIPVRRAGRGSFGNAACGVALNNGGGSAPLVSMRNGNSCDVTFHNFGSPCPAGTRAEPKRSFLGGQPTGSVTVAEARPPMHTVVGIPRASVTSGDVVVEWLCTRLDGRGFEVIYEHKGEIVLIDPSGNVLDASSGRPVEAATVRLQFSPQRAARFATPALRGISPQVNPQVTGTDGSFGWDVAPGFWRLRITAFGYRPLTSPVYKVPPEVTGLKLQLRQDRAQQRLLIDPRGGRVGTVRLRGPAGALPGLRVRSVAGRVSGITVVAKKFRTAHGVAIGSAETDLRSAYPSAATAALRRRATSRGIVTYRVGRATFSARQGRVVAITLGR